MKRLFIEISSKWLRKGLSYKVMPIIVARKKRGLSELGKLQVLKIPPWNLLVTVVR